ncbi:hypothetical protein [Actinomarinicola tropica]|uniref:Uncharacterized protein n=1 Tax=Actinomarinicola tropica TaxID=2789776 RepID=A0A5Q2RQU4_9ACTN|nr:hypothetical protein [Actinomarinicola tropica]QGG96796.1 hypothetical protein GH723_17780 [Actinomarinicola tropica]
MSTDEVKTRLEILEEEIEWKEARLASMPSQSPIDPLADDWHAQLGHDSERASLEAALNTERAERERLLTGAMHLRLTGRPVYGSNVDAEVLERLVRNVRHLARSVGASPLVGVPAAGSHVVEVVAADQTQLGDPFAVASDALLDALATAAEPDVGQAVQRLTERVQPKTTQALSTLVAGIARDGLELSVVAEASGRRRSVGLDRSQANNLARAFADAERALQIEVIAGTLRGALEGAGRFEIEVGGDTITGSVPTDVRPELEGLTIGSLVRATVQRSTTTFSSGRPQRESLSLLAIESLEE